MSNKFILSNTQDKGGLRVESYTRSNYTVRIIFEKDGLRRRRLYIPAGGYKPVESEISITGLNEEEIDKLLNINFLQNRRLCFLCGSKNNIGIACRVCPTAITEEERELQSSEAKALNNLREHNASLSEVTDNGDNQNITDDNYYEPYSKVPEPTISVKDIREEDMYRLTVEIVPCYLCVHCRRNGQQGSTLASGKLGYHISFLGTDFSVPVPKDRNILNKYTQRYYHIVRYKDIDGTYYPITDRISVVRSEEEANMSEINIIQQLELISNPAICHKGENLIAEIKKYGNGLSYDGNGRDNELAKHLSYLIRRATPALLRAASKVMVKSGNVEFKEMQDFEPCYEYSIAIIRAALHLIKTYPKTREHLARAVYQWSANPFSGMAKDIFQNWMDVVWIAALSNIPFSYIRYPVTMYLFSIMTNNYNPSDEKMETLNMKLYLKRVFNEGRNKNSCKELLYTIAFAGMIYEKISMVGIHGLIKIMNDNSCYLPDECLKRVWREMSYVNDNIDSLGPTAANEGTPYKPGVYRHLGLGDPDADCEQCLVQIHKFLVYARRYGLAMDGAPVPDKIIATTLDIPIINKNSYNISTVQRHDALNVKELERLKKLREVHSGEPPLDSNKGAPRLKDKQCAYPGCKRVFSSGSKLVEHLIEAWNIDDSDTLNQQSPIFSLVELHRLACGTESTFDYSYKNYYYYNTASSNVSPHPWNNESGYNDLTPDKVMNLNLTSCPIPHCPMNKTTMTPEQLCDHFGNLGVEPFWCIGWKPLVPVVIIDEQDKDKGIEDTVESEDKEKIGNIWDNPGVCVICMDESCSNINLECGHVNMCEGCANGWKKKNGTCPSCRQPIVAHVSIMAFRNDEAYSDKKIFMAGL